jgi:hypothetical protein
MNVPDILCDFGCDRAASKRLKNGRFLCSEFVAQCPAMRAKNGAPKRGKNPFANRAKGYVTGQVRAKFAHFLRPLRVFTRTDLQVIFEYVHRRCGRNLPRLYE